MRSTSRALVLFLASLVSVSTADAALTFNVNSFDVSLDSGNGIQAFTLADVNSDGRPDILGVKDTEDGFSVYLNDRFGGFPSDPSFSIAAGEGVVAIASGDFDRDGNPDVVLVDGDLDLAIFLFGDGTGNFTGEVDVQVSTGPVAVVVADFDNDSIADTAVVSDSEVYLIRSNGDRTFTPFTPAVVGTRSTGAFAITSGLLDSNAFPDLVVTNDDQGNVSVLLGNGNGTFQAARLQNVGANPEGVAVANLSDDASQDLAVVDSGESADLNVSLLFGNNDGTFQLDQRTTAEVLSVGVAAADFDQDGKVDLAVSNESQGFGVVSLRNDPNCDDCMPPTCDCTNGFDLKEIQGFGDADSIQAADLNGDGKPDIVALSSDGASLGVFLNTTGMISTATPTRSPSPTSIPTATMTPTRVPTPTLSPTMPTTSSTDDGCSIDTRAASEANRSWWLLWLPILVACRRGIRAGRQRGHSDGDVAPSFQAYQGPLSL